MRKFALMSDGWREKRAAGLAGEAMSVYGRGFTLVELLVVMAIITIMAAMLLPVLSKARAAAQQVTCMNNQKQIHYGIDTYREENGEFIIPYQYINLPGTGCSVASAYWYQYIVYQFNLKGTNTILYCPSHKTPGLTYCPGIGNVKFSYGLNGYVFSVLPPAASGRRLQSKMRFGLSSVFIVADGDTSYFDYATFPVYRHGAKCNFLFLDGHVAGGVVYPRPGLGDADVDKFWGYP